MGISTFRSHHMSENQPHLQTWPMHPTRQPYFKCLLFPEQGLYFQDAFMCCHFFCLDCLLVWLANCSPFLQCSLLKFSWSLSNRSSGKINHHVFCALIDCGHNVHSIYFGIKWELALFWSFLPGYVLFKVQERQELVLFFCLTVWAGGGEGRLWNHTA